MHLTLLPSSLPVQVYAASGGADGEGGGGEDEDLGEHDEL
jgi:hypothetical protein